MHIPLHTVQLYNNSLYTLHQCTTVDEFISQTMMEIRKLIPYENGAYFPVNPFSHHFEAPYNVDLDDQLFSDYRDYYWQHDNYRATVFSRQPIPSVDRASDYMNFDDWQKNEYRADFLLPNGMFYLAGVQLIQGDSLIGEISIHRTQSQGDFSESEVQILKMLAVHLQLIFSRIKKTETCDKAIQQVTVMCRRYGLTVREAQILKLLTLGHNNKQIGEQLGISGETVKCHLHNIFHKTKTSSRVELLSLFLTQAVDNSV